MAEIESFVRFQNECRIHNTISVVNGCRPGVCAWIGKGAFPGESATLINGSVWSCMNTGGNVVHRDYGGI